jgi:hypothetical protein
VTRTPLPYRRPNETRDVAFAGQLYSVCVGYDERGQPAEVFADGPREGSDVRAIMSDACVLISIALQHGITRAELERSLGIVPRWIDGNESEGPASLIGAIVGAITPPGEGA